MITASDVTLAIPTYRRAPALLRLLDHLESWPEQPGAIIVVDQTEGVEAEERSAIDTWTETTHHTYQHLNHPNLPAARNQAIARTDTSWIAFLDDDAWPVTNYLKALISRANAPGVDAVAGRVVGGYMPSPPHQFSVRDPKHDVWQLGFDGNRLLTQIASFPGGNHAVRTEAIRAIGGYDEQFTGWAFREDADAALRLWQADYRIDYAPDMAVEHPGSAEGGCRTAPPESRDAFASRAWPEVWFWHKHFSEDPKHLSALLKEGRRRYIFNRENVSHPQRIRAAKRGFDDAVRQAAARRQTIRV